MLGCADTPSVANGRGHAMNCTALRLRTFARANHWLLRCATLAAQACGYMDGHEASIFDPLVASPPRPALLRAAGTTVISYDERMLLHDENLLPLHPERADRIRAVMARLDAAQLTGGRAQQGWGFGEEYGRWPACRLDSFCPTLLQVQPLVHVLAARAAGCGQAWGWAALRGASTVAAGWVPVCGGPIC